MAEKKVASKTNSASPKTKTNNNASKTSGGTTKMKLADMKVIKLTAEEFAAKSADELHGIMCTPDNRISRERGITFLVGRVRAEKLNSITPKAIMNWTYKSVQIEGVTVEGAGFSPEKAKKKLTQKEYNELDAAAKADLIEKYTHKRRAAEIILPALIKKGLPLSAEDVVYLTCGRVEIEGVTIASTQRETAVVTEGVTFA